MSSKHYYFHISVTNIFIINSGDDIFLIFGYFDISELCHEFRFQILKLKSSNQGSALIKHPA